MTARRFRPSTCAHVPSDVVRRRRGGQRYDRKCVACGALQRGTKGKDGEFNWSGPWRGGGHRVSHELAIPSSFPLGEVAVAFPLTNKSAREQVVLFASPSGEIEIGSRYASKNHSIEYRQRVDAEDVQKFYEQLLTQLGYEVPRVKLRRVFKSRLNVRWAEHLVAGKHRTEFNLSCSVGDIYVNSDLDPLRIHASFSRGRALRLCRALADPLGWELQE